MLERGYGKPEVHAVVESEHRFVIAPQVMEQSAAGCGAARLSCPIWGR
jgi:hypothetical protein